MTNRPTIQEVPNPEYIKDQKQRRTFVPVKGSVIPHPDQITQPSLKKQMEPDYKRYELDTLLMVRDVCEYCPDVSDCSCAKTMRAMDMCVRVQRVLAVKK